MMKFVQAILKMALVVAVLGCQSDNKTVILDQAEECMEAYPDSAIRMLEKIKDSTFDFDNQRAKFSLLWTQARHKCHLSLRNDSLIDVAVNYYVAQKDRHNAAKSFLYKGLVHMQNKEVEKATEAFALSEQWFETVEDNQYKALLYNYFGTLMMKEGNLNGALQYLKRSYQFKLKGDSIHYIMSACSAIANVFTYLGQSDSAKIYFGKGMQYKDQVSTHRYCLFLQNYANFLRKGKDYKSAESMLLDCEQHITGRHRFTLYSSLATLYYETKEYHKALEYAEKVLDSKDSVVLRGGFLNLYRIHKQLGNMNESLHFHDLYREYDNDITMRLNTTEVATIPHEVKVDTLQTANKRGLQIQSKLVVGLIGVILASCIFYIYVRSRHKKQRQELQNQLAADKQEINEMILEQSKKNKEIGLLNYQMERKKEQVEHLEDKQKEKLQKEREKIKTKNDEIQQLKENEAVIMRKKRELEKELETTLKKQQNLQEVADRAEHDRRIDQRIVCYRVAAKVEHIGVLLMQLKHGNMYVSEQIPDEKFRPMIESLLDAERPGMRERIDASTNNLTKQLMCYLIALDLNDEDMMFRATGKKLDTIRKYHKECEDLMAGNGWGEGSRW